MQDDINVQALFRKMVNSFMVDFDMNEEDAVIEAIEELNVRGIDHSDLDLSQQRLGAEVGADESKVFEFLSKLVSAAEVHDVATVELQLSNLRPLSINFDSIAEDANFDTVLFGLTSAVLILDNTNFCHFAFSILFELVKRNQLKPCWEPVSKRLYEHILAKVPDDDIILEDFVNAILLGSKHCQQTKQCLMTDEYVNLLLEVISLDWRTSQNTICRLTCSLLTAGEEATPLSLAPVHNFCDKRLVLMCVKSIEVIASYHNILTLVLVLKDDYENPKKNRAENVLRMTKSLLISRKTCMNFLSGGLLQLLMVFLENQSFSHSKQVISCLRRLVLLDEAKYQFVSEGGVQLLFDVLQKQADDLNTTELVLGTLATVTLRNKNATAAVQDAKCISAVFDTMRLHTDSGSIQRQCCMVIRNCAVSCTSFKSSLLNSGAAQLVRAAKYAHPSHCIDVGSAALRDLDCSDYNDGWNPCTLVLGANGDIIDTKNI